ncbi:hypothetical protein Axy09_014 [Achromobacter phage vB_AxyP_19-32_Axy09]|uniref:Uncharacterized protein n=1 Tax=Achromobacter phage vB_AxyP_19-32_Axy09 TaxID=2591040 RepID=A0A514CTT0_9CAUD|nr:hypothetical protein Axy09_014 [Achromobacter phage vB_AxyP_19-32_Axy09]
MQIWNFTYTGNVRIHVDDNLERDIMLSLASAPADLQAQLADSPITEIIDVLLTKAIRHVVPATLGRYLTEALHADGSRVSPLQVERALLAYSQGNPFAEKPPAQLRGNAATQDPAAG